MSQSISTETQSGLDYLETRLSLVSIRIIEQHRTMRRRSTHLVIGAPLNFTTIEIPDAFIDDLPRSQENQAVVDAYAAAVGGRLNCGPPDPPEVFFCRSGVPVKISLHWPIESAITSPGRVTRWIPIDVVNLATGEDAQCSMEVKSFYPATKESPFDIARTTVNSVRKAIDAAEIKFHDPEVRQENYQRVNHLHISKAAMSATEIQNFITAKALSLGFNIPGSFADIWPTDPWDIEYLGVSKTDLLLATRVLRQKGLLADGWRPIYFQPTDKLLAESVEAQEEDMFRVQKHITRFNLPNKEDLVKDIKAVLQRHTMMALVVVDLDNFKAVNDTSGHLVGDACLDKVVKIIGEIIGRKGKFYRWGGDEFAVCLPDFSTEEAKVTAERIRYAVERSDSGGGIAVTTSIGVYATDRSTDTKTANEILHLADKAMYESKEHGKNQVTVWPFSSEKPK